MIRSSGVTLAWNVDELPEVAELTPTAVFCVQRILLEAITNTLKHARAQQLRVTARTCGPDVEICIGDDGSGFDPSCHAAGRGLANMRARAQRIGARITIQSSRGSGTEVTVLFPRAPAGRPMPRAA